MRKEAVILQVDECLATAVQIELQVLVPAKIAVLLQTDSNHLKCLPLDLVMLFEGSKKMMAHFLDARNLEPG